MPITKEERQKYDKEHYPEYYQNNKEWLKEHKYKYRNDNRERLAIRRRELYMAKKLSLFGRLTNDNIKCQHCGIEDIRVLQIDHINGDGKYTRNRSYDAYYNKLLKLSIDELKSKYQLLCCNCNWIKRIENKEHSVYSKL